MSLSCLITLILLLLIVKVSSFILRRYSNGTLGTFGKLYFDDEFVSYTLEPSNLDGCTNHAISTGTYGLSVRYSPKFGIPLPLLSVPSRCGILIHSGNTVRDTRGCILVGNSFKNYRLHDSRSALRFVLYLITHCNITNIVVENSFPKQLNLFDYDT